MGSTFATPAPARPHNHASTMRHYLDSHLTVAFFRARFSAVHDTPPYSLDHLADASGEQARTIRSWIKEGVPFLKKNIK